jgi:hypothetical protein
MDAFDPAQQGPGMTALAAAPVLSSVRSLAVGSCQIGPAEAAALAASPNLGNLVVLNISDNPLTAAGVRALVAAPWVTSLREFYAYGSGLDDEAGLLFANAPGLEKLKVLSLVNNPFTEASRAPLRERFGKKAGGL